MTVLGTLKRIGRRIIPVSIRKSKLFSELKILTYKHLDHDTVYDSDFYAEVENRAVRSAEVIATSILSDLQPSTIVDVGCGTGVLLESLCRKGCTGLGLDYSESALHYCRMRGLSVRKFDLEMDAFKGTEVFDVATSMEVAEHLPKESADRYVDLLVQLSNVCVFTAATPGQGGTDHVNEQPLSYWISMFESRGFIQDQGLSERWRENWRGTKCVEAFYYKNLMIFRRDCAN